MTELEIFSALLRETELKLDYKHPELAHFLGFPLATVIKWVRGRNLPSTERQEIVLAKIKSKLG